MSGSLISCILCLLTSFSVSTCFFPLSLFVSVFCSPRFHKLFYLSFNPFILSSEPQHFFLSCLFSLSLSLPVSVFLCVLSILQTKSTVTVSAITQQTKIYLTENVCKKCILHLQDVLILLFISFSSVYILSA